MLPHLKPISQLRFDYDTTTTRLRRKIDVNFLLASNRVEWKHAGARDTSYTRIVVVSQSNRNCNHGLTCVTQTTENFKIMMVFRRIGY